MKIPLTGGGFTIIDDEDYYKLCSPKGKPYKWMNFKPKESSRTTYASRMSQGPDGKWKRLFIHRVLSGVPDGMMVDHINRNGLDNRKQNLRVVTNSENKMNCLKYRTANKFKGVFERRSCKTNRFEAKFAGQRIGNFSSAIEAARQYDKFAVRQAGELVTTNKSLGLL